MENASKALIMAGSILIALIIIGAFMLMFNNLTDYQENTDLVVHQKQIVEFNNQFSTYDRTGLRGTDMLSLMNKMIDYNARKATEEIGFTKMKITIKGLDKVFQDIRYDTDGSNLLINKNVYTQENLSEIVTKPQKLENKYQKKYIAQLVNNASKYMDIYNDNTLSINQKIEEINNMKWLPKSITTYGNLDTVKKDIMIYYEYSQFKRTYFDSTNETKYDKDTGRIIEMNFKCVGIGE